jgi:uncharacterized protein
MTQTSSKDITAASILGEANQISGRKTSSYASRQTGVLNFLILLLITFYVPTTLIWLGIIPFTYRFFTLFLVLLGFVSYCVLKRYSFYELGFRTDNLSGSLRWNILFCAIGAVGLYMTSKAGILRPKSTQYLPCIYAFYIFFLGPVQEIFFRGILFAEMKRNQILDIRFVLLISTLSFCFLHIIYRHPPMLIITLISGLAWGIIFIRRPNIWGISLSHSLLGALAMFLGVV